MKYLSYPRNADEVYKHLKEQDDGSMIALKPFTVVFPHRFLERDMAYIGDTTRVAGIVMFACEGFRSLFSVCAFIEMVPDSINRLNYNGVDYVELGFDPGSKVFKTLDIVQYSAIVFRIYKEILSNGNVPFYMEVTDELDDTAAVLDTAAEYAGTNIGSQRPVTEIIASLSARNPADLIQYFRQLPPEEQAKTRPNFIGLLSAPYGATNTLSRFNGSYFDQGMAANLVYETKELGEQERLARI